MTSIIGRRMPNKVDFDGSQFSEMSVDGTYIAYIQNNVLKIHEVKTGNLLYTQTLVGNVGITWSKNNNLFVATTANNEINASQTNIFRIRCNDNVVTTIAMAPLAFTNNPNLFNVLSFYNLRTNRLAFVFFPIGGENKLVALGYDLEVGDAQNVVTIEDFITSPLAPANPACLDACWFRDRFSLILVGVYTGEGGRVVATDANTNNQNLFCSLIIHLDRQDYYYNTIKNDDVTRNLILPFVNSDGRLVCNYNDFLLFRKAEKNANKPGELVKYCTYTRTFSDLEIDIHKDQSKDTKLDRTGRMLIRIGSEVAAQEGLVTQPFDLIDLRLGITYELSKIKDAAGESMEYTWRNGPVGIARKFFVPIDETPPVDASGEGMVLYFRIMEEGVETWQNLTGTYPIRLILDENFGDNYIVDWGDGEPLDERLSSAAPGIRASDNTANGLFSANFYKFAKPYRLCDIIDKLVPIYSKTLGRNILCLKITIKGWGTGFEGFYKSGTLHDLFRIESLGDDSLYLNNYEGFLSSMGMGWSTREVQVSDREFNFKNSLRRACSNIRQEIVFGTLDDIPDKKTIEKDTINGNGDVVKLENTRFTWPKNWKTSDVRFFQEGFLESYFNHQSFRRTELDISNLDISNALNVARLLQTTLSVGEYKLPTTSIKNKAYYGSMFMHLGHSYSLAKNSKDFIDNYFEIYNLGVSDQSISRTASQGISPWSSRGYFIIEDMEHDLDFSDKELKLLRAPNITTARSFIYGGEWNSNTYTFLHIDDFFLENFDMWPNSGLHINMRTLAKLPKIRIGSDVNLEDYDISEGSHFEIEIEVDDLQSFFFRSDILDFGVIDWGDGTSTEITEYDPKKFTGNSGVTDNTRRLTKVYANAGTYRVRFSGKFQWLGTDVTNILRSCTRVISWPKAPLCNLVSYDRLFYFSKEIEYPENDVPHFYPNTVLNELFSLRSTPNNLDMWDFRNVIGFSGFITQLTGEAGIERDPIRLPPGNKWPSDIFYIHNLIIGNAPFDIDFNTIDFSNCVFTGFLIQDAPRFNNNNLDLTIKTDYSLFIPPVINNCTGLTVNLTFNLLNTYTIKNIVERCDNITSLTVNSRKTHLIEFRYSANLLGKDLIFNLGTKEDIEPFFNMTRETFKFIEDEELESKVLHLYPQGNIILPNNTLSVTILGGSLNYTAQRSFLTINHNFSEKLEYPIRDSLSLVDEIRTYKLKDIVERGHPYYAQHMVNIFHSGIHDFIESSKIKTILAHQHDWYKIGEDFILLDQDFLGNDSSVSPLIVEIDLDKFADPSNKTFIFKTNGSFRIDWGDGILSRDSQKTLEGEGKILVKLYGYFIRPTVFNTTQNNILNNCKDCISRIVSWGNKDTFYIEDKRQFFVGYNFKDVPTESPDFGNFPATTYLFTNNILFDTDINNWDFSNVKDLNNMLDGCINFDHPINNPTFTRVRSADYFLRNAKKFNSSLEGCRFDELRSAVGFLEGADAFNQDLSVLALPAIIDLRDSLKNVSGFSNKFFTVPNPTLERLNGALQNTSFNESLSNVNTTRVFRFNSFLENSQYNRPVDFSMENAVAAQFCFSSTPLKQDINHIKMPKITTWGMIIDFIANTPMEVDDYKNSLENGYLRIYLKKDNEHYNNLEVMCPNPITFIYDTSLRTNQPNNTVVQLPNFGQTIIKIDDFMINRKGSIVSGNYHSTNMATAGIKVIKIWGILQHSSALPFLVTNNQFVKCMTRVLEYGKLDSVCIDTYPHHLTNQEDFVIESDIEVIKSPISNKGFLTFRNSKNFSILGEIKTSELTDAVFLFDRTGNVNANLSILDMSKVVFADNAFSNLESDLTTLNPNLDVSKCLRYREFIAGETNKFNRDMRNWKFSDEYVDYFRFMFNNKEYNLSMAGVDMKLRRGAEFMASSNFNNSLPNISFESYSQTRLSFLDIRARGFLRDNPNFNQPVNTIDLTYCHDIREFFMNSTSFNQDITVMFDQSKRRDLFKHHVNILAGCTNFNNRLDFTDKVSIDIDTLLRIDIQYIPAKYKAVIEKYINEFPYTVGVLRSMTTTINNELLTSALDLDKFRQLINKLGMNTGLVPFFDYQTFLSPNSQLGISYLNNFTRGTLEDTFFDPNDPRKTPFTGNFSLVEADGKHYFKVNEENSYFSKDVPDIIIRNGSSSQEFQLMWKTAMVNIKLTQDIIDSFEPNELYPVFSTNVGCNLYIGKDTGNRIVLRNIQVIARRSGWSGGFTHVQENDVAALLPVDFTEGNIFVKRGAWGAPTYYLNGQPLANLSVAQSNIFTLRTPLKTISGSTSSLPLSGEVVTIGSNRDFTERSPCLFGGIFLLTHTPPGTATFNSIMSEVNNAMVLRLSDMFDKFMTEYVK